MGGKAIEASWLVIDTDNCRAVTLWPHDDLKHFAERAYRQATGIDITDAADLAQLSTMRSSDVFDEPDQS